MNHFIWELILYSLNFIHSYTRWDPKKPRLFIYKKLCNYSCMFKLQSPSKSSPLDAKHLSRCFSTAPNSFWTCQFGCYLSASAVFCFTSFTLAEDFFHPGKQTKKSFRVRSGEWEGWGLEDMLFLVKNCWTLSMVWAPKSPTIKWENLLKESSKNSLKPNRASHNNAIWHSDTDGFLEHLLSGGSLYYKGPTLHR